MTQPPTIRERLRAGDRGDFSTNEQHAAVLGSSLGLLLGRAGRPAVAAVAIVAALFRVGRGIGTRTASREPWYFAAALVLGYVAGRQTR